MTYIEVGAIAAGISPGFSFYLLSITNASGGFGRVACGILGDKLGALNISAPSSLVCAIMTCAWPFATTKGSLVAVAIIYGFFSGTYITLLPAPLMAMGDMHDAGRRTGFAMTAIAVGAVAGPPISGALIRTAGGFHTVSYYAGTVPAKAIHPRHLTKMTSPTLSSRFIHRCICHTPVHRQIPDAWHAARKILNLKRKGRWIFFAFPPFGKRWYYGLKFTPPVGRHRLILLYTS